MHDLRTWIVTLIALQCLAGCAGIDTLQLTLDQPGDIEPLLEQHEFVRVRQLTARHLDLDTPQLRARIVALEKAHEDTVLAGSRDLEAKDDLLAAVELLTAALARIPDSDILRDQRTRVDQKRMQQLQVNAREQLITRGKYIASQLRLYEQQILLRSPSAGEHREYTRNQQEALQLADQLLEQAGLAAQDDNTQIAQESLYLARTLNNTPEVQQALRALQDDNHSRDQVRIKQASIKQAKQRKKIDRSEQKETEILLKETQQALANKNLLVARTRFMNIPPSSSKHPEVVAVQQELNRTLTSQVNELITAGDSHYRADRVVNAIDSWTAALALDPEHSGLKERLDRAHRVLARLEELKRKHQR